MGWGGVALGIQEWVQFPLRDYHHQAEVVEPSPKQRIFVPEELSTKVQEEKELSFLFLFKLYFGMCLLKINFFFYLMCIGVEPACMFL